MENDTNGKKKMQKRITRRSFLKQFSTGLAAIGAIINGFVNPSRTLAAPTCTETRCGCQMWAECVSGKVRLCEEYYCWDKYNGTQCSHTKNCVMTQEAC
jgi:hypothetical protein